MTESALGSFFTTRGYKVKELGPGQAAWEKLSSTNPRSQIIVTGGDGCIGGHGNTCQLPNEHGPFFIGFYNGNKSSRLAVVIDDLGSNNGENADVLAAVLALLETKL